MVARRVALLAVDVTIKLETFPIDHIAVESRLLSLQGYINRLLKMYWTKLRFEARKKLLEIERLEQAAKG